MDVSLSHHKPRCLNTGGIPSIISLNPCGDHLAVGCTNGDICFWWLPLDDDTTPTHRVLINLPQNGIEVSSILWVSDTLVTLGRRGGLMTVVNLDYVSAHVPIAPSPSLQSCRTGGCSVSGTSQPMTPGRQFDASRTTTS